MARITCIEGHDLPRPFLGDTTCPECVKKREKKGTWKTRSTNHRTATKKFLEKKNKKEGK